MITRGKIQIAMLLLPRTWLNLCLLTKSYWALGKSTAIRARYSTCSTSLLEGSQKREICPRTKKGALSGVLVRNVERDGWNASYQALITSGELVSLAEWFDQDRASNHLDPVHRLDNLVSPIVGYLLLMSNYDDGFYFAPPISGVHGGLHPHDSLVTFFFGWPNVEKQSWAGAKSNIQKAVDKRCSEEAGRHPSTTDLLTALNALI